MDKKVLKFYVAPTSEAVEMKLEGFLCASNPDNPFDDNTADTPVEE